MVRARSDQKKRMKQAEIIKQMSELQSRKEAHLKEYANYIDDLANAGKSIVFFSGSCNECEKIDIEIRQLSKQLINKTTKNDA